MVAGILGGVIAAPVVLGVAAMGVATTAATAAISATATALTGGTAGAATMVAGTVAASTAAATATATTAWSWTIGADRDDETNEVTFDCWKPILHDASPARSKGKALKDVAGDHRVRQVVVTEGSFNNQLPNISLVNMWGEKFDLQYVVLPDDGQFAFHAQRVHSITY